MDENRSSLVVPIAIVVGVLIVAGAFYYKSQNPQAGKPTSTTPTELGQLLPVAEGTDLTKFRPVDTTDKILGSASAPIKLVVYTDLECPACKYFHEQLKLIEPKYITTGRVAVIYRDFPLDSIHSKSRNEFLAAECVNEIGGNDKFWQFIDKIFEVTPSNNGLDPAVLTQTAKDLGINSQSFAACVKANKYASQIQKSVDEATALGAQGTPFFIVVTQDQTIPVFGGISADRLSAALDLLLGTAPDSSNTTASTSPVTQ